MRYLAWLTVSLLALALGCAESKALPAEDDDDDGSSDSDSDADSDTDADSDSDADTDSDSDSDSDTDTDVDSDTDTDSDTGTGSSTECQCFNPDIVCCDGCYFEGTDVVCEPAADSEVGCPWGSDCGSSVGIRYQPRYCPGDVAACIGDYGDFGDWEVDDECGPIEVCDDTDFVCQPDLVTCPVEFGDQVCVAGGFMADCGIFSCSDPPPSITEVLDFASLGVGEVVKLEITTPIRGTGLFDPGMPFSDISATLSHSTTTASFFNQNAGIDLGTIFGSYEFPPTWYLPHFWGQEMGGTWTLYFEDHEFTLGGFDLIEWCIT
ncbi:MAG: hypothetical protein JRF63_03030, partial [Deltaproteobacteria bacterium]|nr:hypothetical protein [Deltaproteobacteria bacterium]